ncbi:MAG: hypothetical protein PSN34_02540 [Urechidicola sp.]|nr:hypothetical protein [Urechidicola sp.]
MKYSISFIFILLLLSCKAQNTKVLTETQEFSSNTECPEDGDCSFELFPNSSINLVVREGTSSYTTIEKGNKTVFKFSFKRNVDQQVVDGHYIEEVFAEFDADLYDLILENKELRQVNLILNRICYCKGSYGSYVITKGQLSLKKMKKNTYSLSIDFKVDEVPQVITSISETLILK